MQNFLKRFGTFIPQFVKNTFITFGAILINYGVAIVIGIIVARTLGPSGKGIYSLTILVPAALVMVGELGLGIANTYFGGSNKYSFEKLASNSITVAIAVGGVLTLGFLSYYLVFKPDFLADSQPLLIVLASSIIPIKLMGAYLKCVILGENRIKVYNVISLLLSALSLSLTFIVLVIFHLGVTGLIASYTASEIAGIIVVLAVLQRTTIIKLAFYKDIFIKSIIFGIKGYAGNLFYYLTIQVGTFMIAHFMDSSSIGYYSVAVSATQGLGFLPAAAATVILARTPGISAEEANRSTPAICRNVLLITFVMALALLISAKVIVSLFFGTAFISAVEPLRLLLPGAVALSVYGVLVNELAGRGKPGVLALASLIALVSNLILNYVLVPRLGMNGAAIAASATYLIACVTALIFFRKITGCGIVGLLLPQKSDFKYYAFLLGSFFRTQHTL